MKNILSMTVILMITSGAVSAQKVKQEAVPAQVKEAFAKKYPGQKAEWEKEGSDYEAGFDLNKIESSAVFSPEGTFKELEQEIKISELPKAVTEYCAKNFADHKLSEGAKITDAAGKLTYEAELTKGKEHFDAIFDQQGNFIKKSEVSLKD